MTSLAVGVKQLIKTFGVIPPDAIVQTTMLKRGVAFTDGGVGTIDLDVGDGTTVDSILANGDVDGGVTTLVAGINVYQNGGVFTANLNSSVDLNTLTAGSCELTVWFIAPN
jgi:hypothetical protein